MKSALVTGASSGIGAAISRRLLAEGYRVYAGARRVDRMASLEEAGATLLSLDITDDASMRGAIEYTDAQGGLDVLVNNAGAFLGGALEDVPLPEARRLMDVNVFGMARLIQLALPSMRRRGSGKIVNVSSAGGKIYEPFAAWYHASKFAVEGLSDCLRMELAPFGIDVIVVEPGNTKTEMHGHAYSSIMQHSGHCAYADAAIRHAKALTQAEKSSMSAPAERVAATVSRALGASRPATRYPAGGGAGFMIAMRRLLSDRMFDRLLRAAFRSAAK